MTRPFSCNQTYDLVTLTVTVDLYLEIFNFGHYFWTIWGRAFIFNMCIPHDKIFQLVPNFWPCDLDFDLNLENLNFVITFEQ